MSQHLACFLLYSKWFDQLTTFLSACYHLLFKHKQWWKAEVICPSGGNSENRNASPWGQCDYIHLMSVIYFYHYLHLITIVMQMTTHLRDYWHVFSTQGFAFSWWKWVSHSCLLLIWQAVHDVHDELAEWRQKQLLPSHSLTVSPLALSHTYAQINAFLNLCCLS